ncbi:MAG TPA: DinB family protein [Methylomirabilota bacterium]|nr:DinB family protein [Methylomirabilota bacterium]
MMMPSELATYCRELRWVLDQMATSVQGLTASQLNWRPPTGSANSAYAIVSHVLGSTRVYALGFGCGHTVRRDRDAEFAVAGPDAEVLIAGLRQLATEIATALAGLRPGALEVRFTPPRELWGTGELVEISRRDALVESIRHAGLHLGELRLTRDLAVRHA